MLNKNEENRKALEIVNLDDLVPREHLLRKIDAAVKFERIYKLVEDLYCPDNGRPSIDPIVLFKIVLIQQPAPLSVRTSSKQAHSASLHTLPSVA